MTFYESPKLSLSYSRMLAHLLREAGRHPEKGGEEPHGAQADLLSEAQLVTQLCQPPLADDRDDHCIMMMIMMMIMTFTCQGRGGRGSGRRRRSVRGRRGTAAPTPAARRTSWREAAWGRPGGIRTQKC